jgi:YD repeat-containing protein
VECGLRFNRVDGWHWGPQSERYSYESHGLLSEISSPQDGTTQFTYNDLNMVWISAIGVFLIQSVQEFEQIKILIACFGKEHIYSKIQ